VAFLRTRCEKSGTFRNSDTRWPLGMAALPAMTLLECGIPADDEMIQGAAKYVRSGAKDWTGTYELVLSLLFLDRLGDPQDKALIRTLSLRLIAGQTYGGGWTYHCHRIDEKEELALESALKSLPPIEWTEQAYGSKKPDRTNPRKDKLPNTPSKGDKIDLPQRVKLLPIMQELQPDQPAPMNDASDNSNTQFGILGVWTARRHGVPVDRSLALIDRRFRASQGKNGGWSYGYMTNGVANGSPAMTCAGLIGLAVGYGRHQADTDKSTVQSIEKDDALTNALKELSAHIGQPEGKGKRPPGSVNLYFMWSVERVGVLYGLKEIGDRDWYAWGSQLLVDRQRPDGSWHGQGHSGGDVCDTCLALLFLKRVNLFSDLPTKFKLK